MHNIRLGPYHQRLDYFNPRQCFAIIGIFGVITIISYFNELSKQGLLSGKSKNFVYNQYGPLRDSKFAVHHKDELIDLDIAHIKSLLKQNLSRKARDTDSQINIALHLGRNQSYEEVQQGPVKVLIYKNVMPNYFYTLSSWVQQGVKILNEQMNNSFTVLSQCNMSLASYAANVSFDVDLPNVIHKQVCLKEKESLSVIKGQFNMLYYKITQTVSFNDLNMNYSSPVHVLVYQHDLASPKLKDCFKYTIKQQGLKLFDFPLNQGYKNQWRISDHRKLNSFQALYGNMAFGVCERLNNPCVYTVMLSHPLDRIIHVYYRCLDDNTNHICHHYRSFNFTDGNLYKFIHSVGNSFFRKLIYHTKQCKLIGDDEICLTDNTASFIVTPEERKTYLENILTNLPRWFGVVGLTSRYSDSLKLFQFVTGLHYSKCRHSIDESSRHGEKKLFSKIDSNFILSDELQVLKYKLLNDSQVTQWISADLAIYNEMVKIFNKQWDVYLQLNSSLTAKNNNLSMSDDTVKLKSGQALQNHDKSIGKNIDYTSRKFTSDIKVIFTTPAGGAKSNVKHNKSAKSSKLKVKSGNNYNFKRILRNSTNDGTNLRKLPLQRLPK